MSIFERVVETVKSEEAAIEHVASDCWSRTKGTASGCTNVGEEFLKGACNQIVHHPWETIGAVAGGIVMAGAVVEAGIGTAGAAVIASVPLAGYGMYRGVQIASTEGIGAISRHFEDTYGEVKDDIQSAASGIGTVYQGGVDDPALAAAKQKVESLGEGTVPLVAGLIGGSGAQLGSQGIRFAGV